MCDLCFFLGVGGGEGEVGPKEHSADILDAAEEVDVVGGSGSAGGRSTHPKIPEGDGDLWQVSEGDEEGLFVEERGGPLCGGSE